MHKKIISVISFVAYLVIPKWHISNNKIKKIIWEIRLFKTGNLNVSIGI